MAINPKNPRNNQTSYVINATDPAETSRLLFQDHILTQTMGGLLPPRLNTTEIHRVLDLACGPGSWVLDVGRMYRDMEVYGVDINPAMIRYAQAQTRSMGLENVWFRQMNILDGLDFPEESFDFVNARFIAPFMSREDWSPLLVECWRIIRPGGTLRLTDFGEGSSSSYAHQHLTTLIGREMWKEGKFFSFDGGERIVALSLVLGKLLRDQGFVNLTNEAFTLEFSAETEAHDAWYHDLMSAYKLLRPFLLGKKAITPEAFDALYEQVGQEMQEPSFLAVSFLLSVYGKKPQDRGEAPYSQV